MQSENGILLDAAGNAVTDAKLALMSLIETLPPAAAGLTLASIVTMEVQNGDDQKMVASVFYNRLDANMKFQSCATLGYAIGEWKLIYSESDKQVDSPYNTYMYAGFPPGPGNNAGEESIKAAIYPAESDYYYFMADVCGESPVTHFAKTYKEHVSNVNKYLTCD